jgi:PAS domain-containing protein
MCFLGTAGAMMILPGPRSVLPGLGVAGMAVTGVLAFKGLLVRIREAEAALAGSDRYIEAVADLAQEAHLILEPRTGRLLYINPAVVRLLGYPREAFTEGGLDYLVARLLPEDQPLLRAQCQRLAQVPEPAAGTEEPTVEETFRILDHRGTELRFQSRMTVFVRYHSGEPAELLAVLKAVS